MKTRKYILILLALSTFCVSCKKSPKDEKDSLEVLTFSASANSTKSHFASESTDDSLPLCWDEYDNLAVYSIDPAGTASSEGTVSGVAYIKSGIGEAKGKFQSSKPKYLWFPGGGTRHFFSYYPCAGVPMAMEEKDGELVVPVYVPKEQEWSDFGRYHVLFASGGEYSFTDEQVVFDDFKPVTSLLKFRLVPDEDYEFGIESITLQSYHWDSEAEYGWYYGNLLPADISGVHYLKVSDIVAGAGELLPQNYYGYIKESGYHEGSYVTLRGSGTNVYQMSAESKDLYAVVFPTDEYPASGMLALKVAATYSVDTPGVGYVTHEAYIKIPAPGFVAGKRYDFVLTVTSAEMRIEADRNAPEWGYDIIEW